MTISPELQVAILSFCQSMIWPLFVGVVVISFRRYIFSILASISKRIEQGDSIQAGPISISKPENKLTRLNELEENRVVSNIEGDSTRLSSIDSPKEFNDVVYLIHSTSSPATDTDGVEWWDLRISIDADSSEILDKIEKVKYHLHPTFRDPNRESRNRSQNFELRTRTWGEFNISADVYFKGYKQPLTLYRYLNYQGS